MQQHNEILDLLTDYLQDLGMNVVNTGQQLFVSRFIPEWGHLRIWLHCYGTKLCATKFCEPNTHLNVDLFDSDSYDNLITFFRERPSAIVAAAQTSLIPADAVLSASD